MMTVNARSEVTGDAACGCRVLRCSCVILTFLASITVFVRFDLCTSDLRSSCCLGMTILSWLAKRAAIVSIRSNVVKAPKSSHITPILRSLHWLKINERIEYKLLSLTYKVLTTIEPSYLHNLITVQPPRSTRSSSLVTLARPSTSCLLYTSPSPRD